jgi:hypothetical protein
MPCHDIGDFPIPGAAANAMMKEGSLWALSERIRVRVVCRRRFSRFSSAWPRQATGEEKRMGRRAVDFVDGQT